jgi:hypothetical protein
MKRLTILTSLTMAGSLALAAPVFAIVPGNDTYAGRTTVGPLPFSDSVDTTEATTDANDTEAKGPCGAPATDASVWYEVTAASNGGLVVDVSGSSYSAAVVVATGGPGTFGFVTCGPGAVTFAAAAGVTYAILAFDFQADGGGNGGTLNITVDESPPPPDVEATVDAIASFDPRTGTATVTGSVICTGSDATAFINVQLEQTVGPFIVTGFGGSVSPCTETAQPWSALVFTDGRFVGGRADAAISVQACAPTGCDFATVEREVKLRG